MMFIYDFESKYIHSKESPLQYIKYNSNNPSYEDTFD